MSEIYVAVGAPSGMLLALICLGPLLLLAWYLWDVRRGRA